MTSCGELITNVGRYVGRPDSVYKERIRQNLNLAVQSWTRQFPSPYSRQRQRIYANGTQTLTLPAEVDRPIWFADVTNQAPIQAGGQWDRDYTGAFTQRTAGRALEWEIDSIVPVTVEPAVDYLTLESSATDDTMSVVIEAYQSASDASGLPTEQLFQVETITLTGETAVTSTNRYNTVRTITRPSRNAAYLTVKEASGGEVIGRVDVGEQGSRYLRIRLLYVPTAGTQLEFEYIPRHPYLYTDNQGIPLHVPDDYVYWHCVHQAAVDMERTELARLAVQSLHEVVVNERQKVLGFGEHYAQVYAVGDDWNDIGVD